MPSQVLAGDLYRVFARYEGAGSRFCRFCYTPEQIAYFRETPVRLIDAEHARVLLWETADHWESADVYRHYLPRMLELLGPPTALEPLYPLHVSETLLALGFAGWPAEERRVVVTHLMAAASQFQEASDSREWAEGIAALRATLGSRADA